MPSYTLVELDLPQDVQYSYAHAMNKWGAIAGRVTHPNYDYPEIHDAPCIWHGAYVNEYDGQSHDAVFWGINDIEDVVGARSAHQYGVVEGHAFARTTFPQQYLDLSALVGGVYTHARDVNNKRIVVMNRGLRSLDGPFTVDLANPTGSLTALGLVPGTVETFAMAINDDGVIVGYTRDASNAQGGFFHRNGAYTSLGAVWDTSAISNSGFIVGRKIFGTNQYPTAYRYDLNSATPDFLDLGHLPRPGHISSCAFSVNNAGHVVGHSSNWNSDARAYIWDGQMRDLNDLVDLPAGLVLEYANDINDAGQICGMARRNADRVPFRLEPIPSKFGFAPEWHVALAEQLFAVKATQALVVNGAPASSVFDIARLNPPPQDVRARPPAKERVAKKKAKKAARRRR
jgi:probable HAF family extracellular repeat protein